VALRVVGLAGILKELPVAGSLQNAFSGLLMYVSTHSDAALGS